ncbi:hypothetical protein BJX63DRAFT_117403 [Aspergillus granulosus]|uniref:Protein kinase domain-containing protein n=1 Tax=Aspergillus granulosus TaxID=176169 RepID=A0ABR4HR01_9EURO
MSENSTPDYKALFLRAEKARILAEEKQRLAEEKQRLAEEQQRLAEELNRRTTFQELIVLAHDLLWRPVKIADPSSCTTGKITPRTDKWRPIKLRCWADCAEKERNIYTSVCRYLQSTEVDTKQLFSSRTALKELGQTLESRPIGSEQDLQSLERFAVENYVQAIITELSKIPDAREEFHLGNGVRFDNHPNALESGGSDSHAHAQENDGDPGVKQSPSLTTDARPDQYCILRVDDNKATLVASAEYKPPHKLSTANLRDGLEPVDLCDTGVYKNKIPVEEPAKSDYNATSVAWSVISQEYHVMIQRGLEFSYITNGFVDVHLWVPHDDPITLFYDFCDPGLDRPGVPSTRIERALCLCLMSFGSSPRNQEWRSDAEKKLEKGYEELDKSPPSTGSKTSGSEQASSEFGESPSRKCPTGKHQMTLRPRPRCAPSSDAQHQQRDDPSDPDADGNTLAGRKRKFSQVSSSSSSRQSTPSTDTQKNQSTPSREHVAQFCTQQCLLGLQKGGAIDPLCPNAERHTSGKHSNRHPIDAKTLVQTLKKQLGKTLDHDVTPMGLVSGYSAPFKITSTRYGYTIVGKATTSGLWKEVSREVDVYRILQRAQGSAVPVFLGAIDLINPYFLHAAGTIRHMLLMGWGGQDLGKLKPAKSLDSEISRSLKEVSSLGIHHGDIRPENMLWNDELSRVLIIDFHRCTLDHPLMPCSLKGQRRAPKERNARRARLGPIPVRYKSPCKMA